MGEAIWCDVRVAWPWGETDEVPYPLGGLDEGLINGHREYDDGSRQWSFHGEGNYGLADSDVYPVLDTLQELGIPYIATSDAKYEMAGEYHYFNGTEVITSTSNDDGVVLTKSDLDDMTTMEEVRAHFAVPYHFDAVPDIVDAMPDKPPTDPDYDYGNEDE